MTLSKRAAPWLAGLALAATIALPREASAAPPVAIARSDASVIASTLSRDIRRCWSPPPSHPGVRRSVRLKLRFGRDGALLANPEILGPAHDPVSQTFAMAAVRAVQRCGPFGWLREYQHSYPKWRHVVLRFAPEE